MSLVAKFRAEAAMLVLVALFISIGTPISSCHLIARSKKKSVSTHTLDYEKNVWYRGEVWEKKKRKHKKKINFVPRWRVKVNNSGI